MDNLSVETNENVEIPQSILRQMSLGHIGTILSNISIVCLILSLGSVLSFLIYTFIIVLGVFVAIVMVMLLVCTLGLVLVLIPNYLSAVKTVFSLISSGGEIMEKYGTLIKNIWPIITPLATAFALASILFLIFDKTQKHTGRKVFSSIVLALSIIILIILIIGGAK